MRKLSPSRTEAILVAEEAGRAAGNSDEMAAKYSRVFCNTDGRWESWYYIRSHGCWFPVQEGGI